MQHVLTSGVHATVYCSFEATSSSAHPRSGDGSKADGGLPGWKATKVVHVGPSGRDGRRIPHDVVREQNILSRIRHPNIVELLDYQYQPDRREHRLSLPLLAITLRKLLDTPRQPLQVPAASLTPGFAQARAGDNELSEFTDKTQEDSEAEDRPARSDASSPVSSPRSWRSSSSTSTPFKRPPVHVYPALDNPHLIRSLAFQLLLALAHIHSQGIAHRDVKPENVMLGWDGGLRLIDFGTAWEGGDEQKDFAWTHDEGMGTAPETSEMRVADNEHREETTEDMVCQVGTGAYRAPELLFSPRTYSASALDLWSAGCVLAELFTPLEYHARGDPLDQSTFADSETFDDFDELSWDVPSIRGSFSQASLFDATFGELGLAASIFRIRGSPTGETWPSFFALPDAQKIAFDPHPPTTLSPLLPHIHALPHPALALDLIDRLLALDPTRRLSASDALRHKWFNTDVGALLPQGNKPSAWYGTDSDRVELGYGAKSLGGETHQELVQPFLIGAKRKYERMQRSSIARSPGQWDV